MLWKARHPNVVQLLAASVSGEHPWWRPHVTCAAAWASPQPAEGG